MKAMLFCAGLGTRLKPFTLHHPKCLVKISRKSLLERNLEYLSSQGIKDVVINIHHFGEQIINLLAQHQNFGLNIEISDESAELLETGGGLVFAKRFFLEEQDFLVMNSDILTDLNLQELIQTHQDKKALATLAVSERNSDRGLFFDENLHLCGWGNAKTGESIGTKGTGKKLSFSGIHVLSSEIFKLLPTNGKFSIMTEYLRLMKTQKIIGHLHHNRLIDVGKPEAIALAEEFIHTQK